MDAYLFPNRLRQSRDARLVAIPSLISYAGQMERCHQVTYGYTATEANSPESLTAEKFRQHMRIFPEGQFMVLDRAGKTVVGTSTNMRLNAFNNDLLKQDVRSWSEITGDG
ncbi:MAG: hypothetical protein JNJ61_13795 [Anaerolineae bacterium]|nr:hypothetical protein [Anaerolineae bacterium]